MRIDTRICIIAGHDYGSEELEHPDWQGTVEEYWQANPSLSRADIAEMFADLNDTGAHPIGGGAMGCFTIMTPGKRLEMLLHRTLDGRENA